MKCNNYNSKTSTMKFRCTPDQEKLIKKKADRADQSVSEYLLKTALKGRTRISSVSKDMARVIAQCQTDVTLLMVEIEGAAKMEDSSLEKFIDRRVHVQEGMEEIWRLLK